jgi:EAL domain-containing protein (putative c-di-GMP-specific phosphodiesterase class I)
MPEAVAQAGAADRPGRVWLLLDDAETAARIEAELSAAGWQVEFQLQGMQYLMLHLYCEAAPPDVLVCSLSFYDGDAFRLMRLLAGDPRAPALFFCSRQPRAVLDSAAAMAAACGLTAAGCVQQPAATGQVAQALSALGPVPRVPERAEPPQRTEQALRTLLVQGRLQVWLQPQLRVDHREVVRVEALMRAEAEDGTPLAAGSLGPALRHHRMLEAATLETARQLCAFVAECRGRGLALGGSLDVAVRSLSDPAFCAELHRIVRRSGLETGWITLEIAESDAATDLVTVIENTSRCRLMGFKLSVDHFGTAHSSLLQLSQLPFSELKIDGSLLARLDADATRQALVATCAGLARGLGLRVVAEGVRTEAALQAAWAAGCAEAQGELLAPAMSVDATRRWLDGLEGLRLPPRG